MPKIYVTQSFLEADFKVIVDDIFDASPAVKEVVYRCAGSEGAALDSIAAFCKDSAELLCATEMCHKDDLDAFIESAEPILMRAFREGDAANGVIGEFSNTRIAENDLVREWSGVEWIHREARGHRQETSARVVHVDVLLRQLFDDTLVATMSGTIASLATKHYESIDEINDALAREVATKLGVDFVSCGILGVMLIAAVCVFVKNRSEIAHTIDSGSICTYYCANEKCRDDPNGKVTVQQILQCFPSDPQSHACPPSYSKKMPYCRFRKANSDCTMLFPYSRPDADDVQPADEKVAGIMEGLTESSVFSHRADWSQEFFFRSKWAKVFLRL